jgi:DNA-directed RNA polymerase I and III subunit RPAC1
MTIVPFPCRQVRRLLEQEKWRECVQLRKRKDHFIFTIESTGAVAPEELFRRALQILVQKCEKLAAGL